MRMIRYILVLSMITMLAGCEFVPLKKKGDDGQQQSQSQDGEQQGDGTASQTIDQPVKLDAGGEMSISSLNDPNSPLSQRVFYFELDSSQIKDEDRQLITTHAEFIASHPEVTVVLEGHADERGSREYNIALGEKRAKAVKQLMVLQGVAKNQIQVISFGEERPVALGHDESAWNLNRRVEILYAGY